MLQLNLETLMIEYCAHSIVMNKMDSAEHMDLKHLLFAWFSSKHFQNANWCIKSVKSDVFVNTS